MGESDTSAQRGSDHAVRVLHPWHIPLSGWLDIARRSGHQILHDHVFIVSSGVAFLALFALLPTLTALISVYGLVSSPEQLSHQLQSLSSMVPANVVDALDSAMRGIARDPWLRFGFGIAVSIVAAVWVAMRGVLGIISALNIVYGEKEKRGWLALLATTLVLALGALVFWLLALAMIVGAPYVIAQMALDSTLLHVLVLAARWLVMAATALVSMAVLYRFGPSHTQPRWQWLSAGSFVGAALWVGGSAGMSLYISNAGQFGTVYGSLVMVMVVMSWFFLTAFVFLLGAEFNVEVARHAQSDRHD